MASIALLVCTVFVFYLLRVERNVSRSSSWALWIPTIWMMIVASRPLATWFSSTDSVQSNEAGSPMDLWTLVTLAFVGIMVLIRRRFNWSGVMIRHRWLSVVVAYMLVSTVWSEITLIAIKRWGRELIAIEMAMLVISEEDPRQALASVFRRSAYVLLPFSVVLIRYYPALGRQYSRWSGVEMWTGVGRQKNELGRLCMVVGFFLLFELYERWQNRKQPGRHKELWADVCVLVMGFYLLVGSDSMTSIATISFGFAIFLSRRWLKKLPQLVLQTCVVLLLIFGISMPFLGGSSVGGFTSMLGRDSTLTGRTEVWAELMPPRSERPLLGYGFGSFWTDARRVQYEIPTAHNGYLDILLELGEVGLVIYSVWLLSCARQLHSALGQELRWASFAISLLLMALIYNATESAFNSLSEFITATLLLTCFAVTSPATLKRPYKNALPLGAKAQALPRPAK
jgi:O-antigen ligase